MKSPTSKILNGHCLNHLRDLPSESVQCVVTSPPYWGLRDYSRCGCAIEYIPRSPTPGVWQPTRESMTESTTHKHRKPNPSCPKCHGSGKDESLEVIWDGKEDCEHEWGNEIISLSSRNWDTFQKYIINGHSPPGKNKTTPIKNLSQGSFCLLCGAWHGQLGLEPTPELYVKHIVEIFGEVKRVLRKDGTVWLNMGDIFQDKQLLGQPWLIAFALQKDNWYLRSDIIFHKRNPMPESAKDRPTKSHEYIFLLTKNARYYYDADAVREEHKEPERGMIKKTESMNPHTHSGFFEGITWVPKERQYNPLGRNLRSVWTITTQPFPDAHFATFPEELVEICVKAGTSEKGCCSECGSPYERILEIEDWYRFLNGHTRPSGTLEEGINVGFGGKKDSVTKPTKTIGWQPTCECNAETVPCTVLDPFAGSGTVGKVCMDLRRSFIGIEIKSEYVEMSERRIASSSLYCVRSIEEFA